MAWAVEKTAKKYPGLSNPILIEGLPGIGNVGKVAVDFMIAELKAEKLCRFFSFNLPNSVFVNEHNLVELPTLEMYYKKRGKGKRDIIFLAGDIQPTTEESSYDFCDTVIRECSRLGCKEMITLGGIGLSTVSKIPKVYCTGNDRKLVKHYTEGTSASPNLYGVVGPIVGVTGLLIGMAERKKLPAVALLAETLAHPMYLGINIKRLEQDIKDMESEMGRTAEAGSAPKKLRQMVRKETSYIG
jgi:proteasome assembly chaperone (PAC2) family protein